MNVYIRLFCVRRSLQNKLSRASPLSPGLLYIYIYIYVCILKYMYTFSSFSCRSLQVQSSCASPLSHVCVGGVYMYKYIDIWISVFFYAGHCKSSLAVQALCLRGCNLCPSTEFGISKPLAEEVSYLCSKYRCIYTYIYTYLCIAIFLYMYIYLFIHMYICIFI